MKALDYSELLVYAFPFLFSDIHVKIIQYYICSNKLERWSYSLNYQFIETHENDWSPINKKISMFLRQLFQVRNWGPYLKILWQFLGIIFSLGKETA